MKLRQPYHSINNWTAQIDDDTVILSPLRKGKGKFVVEGWNPKGEFCIYNHLFDSPFEARAWLLSLDPRTEMIICDAGSASVFICFDGSYWWSMPAKVEPEQEACYYQLPMMRNMRQAVKVVKKILENLNPEETYVKSNNLIHQKI